MKLFLWPRALRRGSGAGFVGLVTEFFEGGELLFEGALAGHGQSVIEGGRKPVELRSTLRLRSVDNPHFSRKERASNGAPRIFHGHQCSHMLPLFL